MKIVLVHRYFWPDTPPYAVMLRYISKALSEAGFDVTVISTQPSYKQAYEIPEQPWRQEIDGYRVLRLKMGREKRESKLSRLRSMFAFNILLAIALLRERPDITMISTVPQVLGGLVVRFFSKLGSSRFVYHCQDIHPEAALVSGILGDKLPYRLLRRIDRKTCDAAARVVVLSEDMKQSILERGCHGKNIEVINNFELLTPETGADRDEIPAEMRRTDGKFRVLFAGNIGRFQGLEAIIEVAKKLKDRTDIEFVFVGEGAAVEKLTLMAGDLLGRSVHFYGHQSVQLARRLVADAQIGVVSLSKGVYKYAFPSKTMTYLSVGCPLLVMVETDSELAGLVESQALGIVAGPGDSETIERKLRLLADDPAQLHRFSESAACYAEQHFKIERVLPKWVQLFKEIEKECQVTSL